MPNRAAVAFIFARNASVPPASHRASSCAMLSAEGSKSATSACRSVSTSFAVTFTRERSAASCAGYAAASAEDTVIVGPSSPAASGWSDSTTYAVITLATLAIGAGRAAPDVPRLPTPTTSSAAWPWAGQGSTGGVPGITTDPGSVSATCGSGSGRASRYPAATLTAPSTATSTAATAGRTRPRPAGGPDPTGGARRGGGPPRGGRGGRGAPGAGGRRGVAPARTGGAGQRRRGPPRRGHRGVQGRGRGGRPDPAGRAAGPRPAARGRAARLRPG